MIFSSGIGHNIYVKMELEKFCNFLPVLFVSHDIKRLVHVYNTPLLQDY